MTPHARCPSSERLIAVLYGEADAAERQLVEAHLAGCAECAEEFSSLEGVRAQLAAWEAPELRPGFELVPRRSRTVLMWWRPAVGYAAAASILLAAVVGLANLEVRYSTEGLTVRTGWSRGGEQRAVRQIPTSARTISSPVDQAGPVGADEPWRAELVALESRLRHDLGSRVAAVPPIEAPARPATTPSPGLMREVQRLIDQSEVRQQQNLALRVAEVSRDFDLQRKADMVQIEQGLGRLEGQRGIDLVQHRQMWNYFQRVSGQAPPR